jgi:putative SOS response-associated peptidase YedK
MCGRFTLTFTVQEVEREFKIDNTIAEFKPSYNIAPSQPVPVVVAGSRVLDTYRWGLVLEWMLKMKKNLRMINARVENIMEKPTYKHTFTKQRCLIPASGFYEWKKTKDDKIPHYITLKNKMMFAFAGMYSIVEDNGKEIKTCSIITTPSNGFMSKIHNRMPQILDSKQYDAWLNPKLQDKDKLLDMLKPIDSRRMQSHPVDPLVNSPKNNVPECIAQI